MFFVFLWLVQDLITVFAGGSARVPQLFILGLVYGIITDERDEIKLSAIWASFAGGILWDLRWVGVPGFFTIGYVLVTLIVIHIWNLIPPQGRSSGTGWIVFVMLELSQIIPPLFPVLILGGATGLHFFVGQQFYSLPVIIFCMYLRAVKMKNENNP